MAVIFSQVMESSTWKMINGGVPIGLGVVEAFCTTLTKQRFGASGMRWKSKSTKCFLYYY